MLFYNGIRQTVNLDFRSSYLQELEMENRKRHKLLYPPRYPRGDPRNYERMRLGANLGRMIQRYDKLAGRDDAGKDVGCRQGG